jgi:nucleotide-binding universal stress UspA family protein
LLSSSWLLQSPDSASEEVAAAVEAVDADHPHAHHHALPLALHHVLQLFLPHHHHAVADLEAAAVAAEAAAVDAESKCETVHEVPFILMFYSSLYLSSIAAIVVVSGV